MSSIEKFIKGYDYFGAPIGLKYQGEGKAYSTTISGIFSISLKLLLLWLVVTKLIVIAEGDSTLVGYSEKYIDPEKVKEVSMEN